MDELAGRIDDLFDDQELDQCVKYFKAFKTKSDKGMGQKYFSLDEKHPFYGWFDKLIFSKIKGKFGQDANLLLASLLESSTPFIPHSDYYHKRLGEPFMIFLIPLSVDGSREGMDRTSTVIFDQLDDYVDASDHRQCRPQSEYLDMPVLESNAAHFRDDLLSHCDPEILSRLSVRNIVEWKPHSLLYWDAKLIHCSNNYKQHGVNNKEAMIIHSYKDR